MDVQGVFHDLYAPAFPAMQDRMVLVTVIEWDQQESGTQWLRIDMLDPDQTPVATVSGGTDVIPSPTPAPPRSRLVMPMDEVPFPTPGMYLFQLHVGEAVVPLAPLYLIENPDARE
jgi:hypothetical protein